MVPLARDYSREQACGNPNTHQKFGRNNERMNNQNPSFLPTGPRSYQNNGGAWNNHGRNNQNGNGNANNNWNNNRNGNGNANNNWNNNRNGNGNANNQWNNNRNGTGNANNNWNNNRNGNGNANNQWNNNQNGTGNANPNYKGKNFNPNYKGKNFIPGFVRPVRQDVGQAQGGYRGNQQPNGNRHTPYPQRQGSHQNTNYNAHQNQYNQPMHAQSNGYGDLDIEMIDAPSDEPNDIEMPDAPPLIIDPRIEALTMGSLAVKEVAEAMIAIARKYDPSFMAN